MVRLVVSEGSRLILELTQRDGEVLGDLLSLYPIKASTYYRLSKQKDPRADHKLLDQILSEKKAESKRRLATFISELKRLPAHNGKIRLHLDRVQIDWLLQVLNELRVGSWFALGSPDEKHGEAPQITERTAAYFCALRLTDYFQSNLLQALRQ